MPATTLIHLSRFDDERTDDDLPPLPADAPPEVVTLHLNLLAPGRVLVMGWSSSDTELTGDQRWVVDAPSLEYARLYVPSGYEQVPLASELGIEAYIPAGTL